MQDIRVATPAQCRAARALLNWTQAVLAERAGVARKTIADFELATRTLHIRTRRDITATLETAGIEFSWDDSQGVRFAPGAPVNRKRAKPAMA